MKRRRRLLLEELEQRLCLAVPTPYPNTPFQLPQGGASTNSPFAASPVFADLNGDGKDELIAAVAGGRLVAYQTNGNGTIVPFKVYDTGSSGNTQANIKATPIVIGLPNGHKGIFAAL